MKGLIPVITLTSAMLFAACSNDNSNKESVAEKKDSSSQIITSPVVEKKASVNEVISGYIELQNALANDNSNDAVSASGRIKNAIDNVDTTGFTTEQKKVFNETKDEIKEHAEHINSNGSNIAHQRKHFDYLSQDIITLVKAIRPSRILYRVFCPMYNEKEGAAWLSETKEIKNPYYGKEMPDCGEVKEEIKAK